MRGTWEKCYLNLFTSFLFNFRIKLDHIWIADIKAISKWYNLSCKNHLFAKNSTFVRTKTHFHCIFKTVEIFIRGYALDFIGRGIYIRQNAIRAQNNGSRGAKVRNLTLAVWYGYRINERIVLHFSSFSESVDVDNKMGI